MAKTALELIQETPPDEGLMETDAQVEIIREAARNLEATPSDISRETGYRHQTVTNALRKTTDEILEKHAGDILGVNGGTTKQITNVYVFSDMDEEEIRRVLRIGDE